MHNKHQSIPGILLVVTIFAQKSSADELRLLLSQMKRNDLEVSQGTIHFQRRSFPLVTGGKIPGRLVTPTAASQQTSWTSEVFKYDSAHRFRREVISAADGTKKHLLALYDGENELVIGSIHGKPQVSIRPNQPVELSPAGPLIGFAPGTCLVLGRGLSKLTNPEIKRAVNRSWLEGKASDGTTIRAFVDGSRTSIPEQIDRLDSKGQLIGRFVLKPPFINSQSVQIPSRIVYVCYVKAKPFLREEYKITSADFSEPDRANFSYPLRQGTVIVDERLGTAIVFEKKSAGIISKASLLNITRHKLELLSRQVVAEQELERRGIGARIIFVAIPLLVAFVWCAVFRSRPRKHQPMA